MRQIIQQIEFVMLVLQVPRWEWGRLLRRMNVNGRRWAVIERGPVIIGA